MSRNNRGPGPVPNRWLNCPRKSETIIAERFLAFKTPLSKDFNDQIPIECLFLPGMIFDYCKTLKIKLGLWIDLTNTKRFYDREVVESRGVQYVKLQCRGHGETPSVEQTRSFIELVDHFINERPFDIIAVHCTHGFNRTGFLIASYLVERLDCSVGAALAIFAAARPPGIYKQDYINELFRRYEDEEDATPAPELPNWCLEFDDGPDEDSGDGGSRKRRVSDMQSSTSQQALAAATSSAHHSNSNQFSTNGGGGQEGLDEDDQIEDGEEEGKNGTEASASNGKSHKKRRKELVVKNATFMDGVPGVVLVTDQERLEELQHKVQDMCGWDKSGFPGAQPVSMDRHNIKRLHEIPYRVSWKADGTRYMMLINKRDEIYFFDRNNSCFQVKNMTFLKAGNLSQHLEDTLLDGEMVLDKLNGQTTPRYLIYDIVKISNRDIGEEPFFPNRLRCIKKEIIDPRYEAISKGIINRPQEPFSVRNKEFWEIRQSVSLLGEKFAKSLLHEPDGLIFQPSKQPYTAGVCRDVLKWKPSDLNSVDFHLKIAVESGAGILPAKIGLLFVGGQDVPFSRIKYTKAIRDLDNKIIECTVNNQGHWEFLRERTDKKLPNSYNTAQAVVESIRHPITREILLDYIANYGFQDDHDMMPPPPPQNQRPAQHHQQQQQLQHHRQQQHQQQQQQHQQQQQQHQRQQQQHHQQQQQQQQHLQQQQQQRHHRQLQQEPESPEQDDEDEEDQH